MMDGWQVLAMIASVVFAGAMLRLIWVAAFRPDETVSTVPELDGYGRGRRRGEPVGQAPQDGPSNRSSDSAAPSDEPDEVIGSAPEPGETAVVAGAEPASEVSDTAAGDGDGIWIELDIEPLFSSSDTSRSVDGSDDEEIEVSP